jgi:hypothetical protein
MLLRGNYHGPPRLQNPSPAPCGTLPSPNPLPTSLPPTIPCSVCVCMHACMHAYIHTVRLPRNGNRLLTSHHVSMMTWVSLSRPDPLSWHYAPTTTFVVVVALSPTTTSTLSAARSFSSNIWNPQKQRAWMIPIITETWVFPDPEAWEDATMM